MTTIPNSAHRCKWCQDAVTPGTSARWCHCGFCWLLAAEPTAPQREYQASNYTSAAGNRVLHYTAPGRPQLLAVAPLDADFYDHEAYKVFVRGEWTEFTGTAAECVEHMKALAES